MACVLLLAVAACGGSSPSSPADGASQEEIAALASEALEALDEAMAVSGAQLEDAAVSASEAAAVGDLALATPGVLLVGTNADFLPFTGRDEDGGIIGFDIDLMGEVAARLGVEAMYVDMPFTQLTGAVANNEVDVAIAAITVTDQREEIIDFSRPYFVGSQSLAAPPGTALAGVDDLDGDTAIAVLADTTGQAYAEDTFAQVTINAYPDRATALGALAAGAVDAVFMDTDAIAEQAKSGQLVLVEEIATSERYGIGLAEDNAALRTALNEVLGGVIGDGTYATLFATWFPNRDVEQVVELIG